MMQSIENRLSINKMYCIPTEHTYDNMYKRNFSLGLTPSTADGMYSYFARQGVGNNAQISMTSAASELNGIVKMSARPDGVAGIPNGWNTQRLMFVLVVDECINNSMSLTHYIQGYSEYYDPSYAGSLDPNASYYINSVTTVTRTMNVHTNRVDSRVTSAYNVISDPTGNSSYQAVATPGENMELIRPSDVITNLYAQDLYTDMPNVALNVTTSSIGNGGNVSTKANNDPLKYFTNTVNAVICGKSVDVGYNNPEGALANANGIVAEQAITNNAFMRELARLTGCLEPWYFTLNQLTNIDQNVNSKITLVSAGTMFRDPLSTTTILDTNNTENMLNYTVETEVAQTFNNSLTANMSENLITVIAGTITNMTGASIVTISNLQSFLEGVDITPYGNRIINYVNSVIMPQLTINNMRLVDIVFECDLLGDSTISVSVDNQPAVVYRLPTFADSLYSPVIATAAAKEGVIGDFETVVDTVISMQPENTMSVHDGYSAQPTAY